MKFDEITAGAPAQETPANGKAPAKKTAKAPTKPAPKSPPQDPQAAPQESAPVEDLAAQGRNGDTEIAHMTPGEIVIPVPLQTPELMNTLNQVFAGAGVPIEQYTVASSESRINPETGMEEYGFGKFLKKVAGVALPIAASFIPGVGPIASAALTAGAGALGAKISGGNPLMGALAGGLGSLATNAGAFGSGTFGGMGTSANPLTFNASPLDKFAPFFNSASKAIGGMNSLMSGTSMSSPSGINNIMAGDSPKSDLPEFFSSFKNSESPLASRKSAGAGDVASAPSDGEDFSVPGQFDATAAGGGTPRDARGYGGAPTNDPTNLPWLSPPSGSNNVLDEWNLPPIAGAAPTVNPSTGVQQFAAPQQSDTSFLFSQDEFNTLPSAERDRMLPYMQKDSRDKKDYYFSIPEKMVDDAYANFPTYQQQQADAGIASDSSASELFRSIMKRMGSDTPAITPPAATESPITPPTPYSQPKSQDNPLAFVAGSTTPTTPPPAGATANFRDRFAQSRSASMDAGMAKPVLPGAGSYVPKVLPYLAQQNPATGNQEFFYKGKTTARGREMPLYSMKNVIAGNNMRSN